MAGDLQATLEISVELSTFHNVDLFQRGYYQIRCSLKPPEKSVSCVDVEYKRTNGDYQPDDSLYPALVTPTGLTAVSKTFQILYKNEEVILADPFIFRINMLVDSNKLTDQIDQADIQLLVELYFSDSEVGPESPDSLVSVSSQMLKLHLSSIKGLHHHVPILFDYFHFAIVDTTIHAVLVKLSLPDPSILKIPKSSWFSKASANARVPTPLFYSKLFGNKPINNILSTRTPAEERQIRFAYDTHRSLCSTLLSVQVNLLAYFECLSEFLPESQKIQIGSLDFGQRLDSLFLLIESIQNANEVFSQICSDLDNISMELSLVWSQFLESFTLNKQVLPHFRDEHHRQRIGHFSEAFFVQEFPWDELQIYQEQSYQMHQSLGQGIKNSRYYQTIPAVAIECPCLDGDSSSTPIIFEDKYIFMAIQQGASSDSDLEKIELSVDFDGFKSKNVGEDEIVTIESDMNDVPASKDDPNSLFPLSGIMCNGKGPVRETMILDDESDDGTSNLSKALQEILISQEKKESQFVPGSNIEDETSQEDCKDNCSVGDDMSECDHLISEDLCNAGHLSENLRDILTLELSIDNGQICGYKEIDAKKFNEHVTKDLQELHSGDQMKIGNAHSKIDDPRTIEIITEDNGTAIINESSTKASIDQGNDQYLQEEKVEHNTPKNDVQCECNDSQERISEQEFTGQKSECNDEDCGNNDRNSLVEVIESNDNKIPGSNEDNENGQGEVNEKQTQKEITTKCDQELPDKENEPNSQQSTFENIETNEIRLQNTPNGKEKGITCEVAVNKKTEKYEKKHCEIGDKMHLENQTECKKFSEVLDGKIGHDTANEDEETEDTEDIQGEEPDLFPLKLNKANDTQDSKASELDFDHADDKAEAEPIDRDECKDNAKESTICNDKCGNLDSTSPKFAFYEANSLSKIFMPEEQKEEHNESALQESALLENEEKPCGQIQVLDDTQSINSELKQSLSVVTFLSAQEDIASSMSSGSPSQSVYETPTSSQTTFSTQSDVDGAVQKQQKQQHQHQHQHQHQQAVQENTNKKVKKKANQKGLTITGCLPVNCSGNTSPSFTRGSSIYGGSVKSRFELAKKYMKRQLKFSGQIYSDIGLNAEREPYFSKERVGGIDTHLVVCVHGLDGNSGDLRLFKCYLEMALPSTRIDFLMSEINQGDTFVSFEELTDRLVQEILHFIDAYSIFPSKISFVGHSLGNIIIRSALTHPSMQPLLERMHTFLSLSGPHVGMLYPTSPLVSTGLWLMQKWKKSEALTQLSLNDHEDLRQTCIYRLSQSKGLQYFKNVLLVSSVQDHYVPYHSARIEMCKAASRDTSEYGTIYREMITNLLSPLKERENMTFIRYSCYHALTSSANSFIGRAAHIAMLDSELFIEKLLLVSALDYFR